jgi:1-aminocyclopropane-1-carboxylate deaminase
MLAPALAAIAAFEVVLFCKNNEPLWRSVKILRVQFLLKHHCHFGSPKGKEQRSIPEVHSHLHPPSPIFAVDNQRIVAMSFKLPSPYEPLDLLPGVDLWIKRDDLIHPVVSGNKWRKLKGFFQTADPSLPVLTFGGAYSNHLPAAAFALKHFGYAGIAVVRGEELAVDDNAVLRYCVSQGMKVHFASRSEYRELRERGWEPTPEQRARWALTDVQILPEGGAGEHARSGTGEIWSEIAAIHIPNHLVIASGTGTTVRGIISEMPTRCLTQVHVVSAVRGAHREETLVKMLAEEKNIKLQWIDEVAFGGFGKGRAELAPLAMRFTEQTQIPIELNYNAKVWAYLQKQNWNGRVCWVHTGINAPQIRGAS